MNRLHYALRQLLVAPVRRALWKRKRRPFVKRLGRKRAIRLVPGEYVDGEIFVNGAYEYRLLELVARRIEGGLFVDVGANIGNHALYLAPHFDRVICFEPNPPVADRLAENVALSVLSNVEVVRVGLGAEDAELPFRHNAGGNAGGGTFGESDFPVSGTLPIRVGDDLLADRGPVRLLKVDVEGFEPFVFEGLRRTIARDRPIVILEHDGRADNSDERWEHISAFLPGYRFAELRGIAGQGLSKAWTALRHGVDTQLAEFKRPKRRFYESVLAFPDNEAARSFGLATPVDRGESAPGARL